MARLEPESTFYDVMTEVDKENAEYWCARRESNPRPSASESVSYAKVFCNIMLTEIDIKKTLNYANNYAKKVKLSMKPRLRIARNLNERNAWSMQYHHVQVNP